jgi:predicted GNAT family acetyltransferase
MLQLVDEFFAVKNDPSQLDVTPIVMEQLNELHPATLSEEVIGDGPVCWILLIPSTQETMEEFLSGKIPESEILKQSMDAKKEDRGFECIYLCSAIVLPEFRNRGIAKKLTIEAITSMQKDFDIRTLYSWPFSNEGKKLSMLIGVLTSLPVKIKE